MRKCLIILVGLLALTSKSVNAECDPYDIHAGYCSPVSNSSGYNSMENQDRESRQFQSDWRAAQARESQRREDSRKWEPVIVNGPSGARMYYPNGDGTFYQTYDR